MAGIQRTIGYKPATHPSGWGGPATPGTMRGTTFAGRNKGYWISRLGGRLGRGGSGDTTIAIAAYAADKNTWLPGARLGNTNAFVVKQLMADRVSGADHEHYVSGGPIAVPARQEVTLAALGTGNSWAHGQDNSGATMHERNGLGSLPTNFASTNSRPEGNMALWGIAFDDATPTIPLSLVSPGDGQSTIDDTPTIVAPFRSDNEVIPGYSAGQADKITKYQIQVYNAARTSKLHDSGRQNASPGMVTARAAEWTVPSALAPADYVIRAQVFNAMDTPSAWVEWKITVVGAGSVTLSQPSGVTNDDTPDINWSYSHKQGLAMDAMRVRIMNHNATSMVRPDALIDFSPNPASPSTGVVEWTSTPWAALPLGATYTALAQAIDTDGQPSPWSAPLVFRVNAPPYVPINREPLPGAVLTAIPELSAMARDSDNEAATTPTVFEVRKVGSSTSVTQSGIYDRTANRWRLNLSNEGIIAPGDYDFWEWRTRSTDQYGAVGEWSSWITFEYASAPLVTVIEPSGTIAVSNPAFDWDVDRAQTSYRVQLFDANGGSPIRNGDSGWVTSTTTAHTFPSLLLRNNQEVTARIDVITTGNIPGSIEWDFDVAYTPPPTVTGVVAETITEPYDFTGTATSVKISWDEAGTDPVTFSGYLIHRVNTITGDVDQLAVIRDITQTEWVDNTPAAGVVYEYQVMQEVWVALDLIPSAAASDTAMVERIVGLVVTPVLGGGEGVALAFLDSVNVSPTTDTNVRKSWAPKPRISRGPMQYRVVDVSAIMPTRMEARFGMDDMLESLRGLAGSWVDAEGTVRARTVCIRLSDGRAIYGSFTNMVENRSPQFTLDRYVSFQITESNFKRGGE